MLKLFTDGWIDYFRHSATVIAVLCNFEINIYSSKPKCLVILV